ncbi:hypothetical protein GQ42DRAFT_88783 [Ramicandelaber brevisporus]|nr:hypothetical protein GQ42DRAFT_88783 [Ramicandelaber brevisporus]
MTTKQVRISEVETTAVASYFRLSDLPFDLREYVTQFVDRRTAARLLTVSFGFHELFARCVWRCIDKKVFSSRASKTTRASAFARYGRLVRRVYFRGILYGLDRSIDLTRLLPNVAVFNFDVGNDGSNKKQALYLIRAVSGLHGLRSLEVAFGPNYHQLCLEPLADALVSRQQNQNWQRLRRLKLVFMPHGYNYPWADMANFVVKVTPVQIDNLEITIKGCPFYMPTAEQMAVIGSHLTNIPYLYTSVSGSPCIAHLNEIIYSQPALSGNDVSFVFSCLEALCVKLCCASSVVYDYADFTPAKFPRIETMTFYVRSCDQDTMSMDPAFVHPVLNQCWPTVSSMNLYGITTSSRLYTVLDHNPQIINLDVQPMSFGINNDQTKHFSLVDIVKRLPMLETLFIVLDIHKRLHGEAVDDTGDDNEESDLLYIKNSRLRDIRVRSLTMTSDCLEMLYMLPKLEKLTIIECDLDNPVSAFKKITQIQQLNNMMKSDKHGAKIRHIEFEKVGFKFYHDWSFALVVTMVAAAPNIKSIKFDKVTSELLSIIAEGFPNVKLIHETINDDSDSDEDDSEISEYNSDMESSEESSDDSDFSDFSDGEASDSYESDDQIIF